jgi:hypothetical protein
MVFKAEWSDYSRKIFFYNKLFCILDQLYLGVNENEIKIHCTEEK